MVRCVEDLQQLAGAVHGALEGARARQEQRPQLAQVRRGSSAAGVALLLDELADALGEQTRIHAQQAMALLAVGLELRGRAGRP